MECAELHAATTDEQFALWHSLGFALAACPYPALVEFATHHGRTLLTLAERSLEAGLSAAAAAAAGGGGSSGRGSQAGGAAMDRHLHAAMMLAGCLSCCLEGGVQGRHLGQNASAIDPAGEAFSTVQLQSSPFLLRFFCGPACTRVSASAAPVVAPALGLSSCVLVVGCGDWAVMSC
jgi:hypothetical protein